MAESVDVRDSLRHIEHLLEMILQAVEKNSLAVDLDFGKLKEHRDG